MKRALLLLLLAPLSLYGTKYSTDAGPGSDFVNFAVSVDTGSPELRAYAVTGGGGSNAEQIYIKEVKLVRSTGEVLVNRVYNVWIDPATHVWTSPWTDLCGGGTFTGYGRVVYKIMWTNGTVTILKGHNSNTVTKSFC
jgi:hypothetical protein